MKSKPGKIEKIDEATRKAIAEMADFEWKQLHAYQREIAKFADDSPYKKFLLHQDSFFKRAQVEADFLEKKIHLSMDLNELESLAESGDILGLRTLAFLATEATKRLNTWAGKHPEYVAVVAESMPLWPILVTEKSARDSELKSFLKSIHLDKRESLGVSGTKVGSAPVESKKWALSLLQAIQEARSTQGIRESKPSLWSFRRMDKESLDLILTLPERDEMLEQAKALAPLASGATRDWWNLARKILRLTMQHRPESVAKLKAVYGQTDRIKDAVDQNSETAGITKSEAVEEVRKAFYRLGKLPSP